MKIIFVRPVRCLLLLFLPVVPQVIWAQSALETNLLLFERSIEKAVVDTDLAFLERAYADDFYFKHGTGGLDNKSSWLKSVKDAKGKFISRTVDSVEIDLHKNVGVTNGKITVTRKTDKGERIYMIRYVRVYGRKGSGWELISHRTVYEKDF